MKDAEKENRDDRSPFDDRWVLLLIIGTAFALYLYRLADNSFWTDEARLLRLIRLGWHMVIRIDRPRVDPPLGMLWHWAFLSLGQPLEFTVRLSAVIPALLSIPLVYVLGRRLFNRRVGLLAAALFAWHPLTIRYAQELRYYTLFTFLALLNLQLLLDALAGKRRWWPYLLSAAVAMGVHPFFPLLFAAEWIGLLLWQWAGRRWPVFMGFLQGRGEQLRRGFLWTGGSIAAIVVALSLPLAKRGLSILSIFTKNLSAGAGYSPLKASALDPVPWWTWRNIIKDTIYRFLRWFSTPTLLAHSKHMILLGIPGGHWLLFAVVVLLFVWGSFMTWRRYGGLPLWLFLQVIGIALSLALVVELIGPKVGVYDYGIRRMLFLLPFYLLLVAVGLDDLSTRLLGAKGKTASVVLGLALAFAVAWSTLPAYYGSWGKDDWRQAAAYIETHGKSSEPVLVGEVYKTDPEYITLPLRYYFSLYKWHPKATYWPQNTPPTKSVPVLWRLTYEKWTHPGWPGYRITEQKFIGPFRIWVYHLQKIGP